jgi:hypothetical protein
MNGVARHVEQPKPLPFRGGVGVGLRNMRRTSWIAPTPHPSPEGEGLAAARRAIA